MKLASIVGALVIFSCVSICNADIIAWSAGDDGDGVIYCPQANISLVETGTGQYDMTMDGSHDEWEVGHIVGSFETNSVGDPTIQIANSIDNDSGFEWTDYHINIYMDQAFTIDAASVTDPGDWNPASITAPNNNGGSGYTDYHGNHHNYKGSINYYVGSGTPVPDTTGTLDFDYTISFAYYGTIGFCQEMIPTPEPGTLVLLACGLFGLVAIRRRFA
ncbi:MAG: PEP-CTERM sorting domain-containing protein [Thermoguttaceae bacterium]